MDGVVLRVIDGPDRGRAVELAGALDIGRDAEAGLALTDERVSRRHARVAPTATGATIEDLGSSNGTYVNDRRIDATVALADGDRIRIGGSTMTVSAMTVPAAPVSPVGSRRLEPRSPFSFGSVERRRSRRAPLLVVVAVVLCGAVIGAAVAVAAKGGAKTPQTNPKAPSGPRGTVTYKVRSRNHVAGRVRYSVTPPVGGDHNPVPQNCGYYSQPIVTEHGVHSLEHGAVWITYQPSLPVAQRKRLHELARQPYVLVSPWPGLRSPLVASAWDHQLLLQTATDPRLVQFLKVFRGGPQAPERGRVCSGGAGIPE